MRFQIALKCGRAIAKQDSKDGSVQHSTFFFREKTFSLKYCFIFSSRMHSAAMQFRACCLRKLYCCPSKYQQEGSFPQIRAIHCHCKHPPRHESWRHSFLDTVDSPATPADWRISPTASIWPPIFPLSGATAPPTPILDLRLVFLRELAQVDEKQVAVIEQFLVSLSKAKDAIDVLRPRQLRI